MSHQFTRSSLKVAAIIIAGCLALPFGAGVASAEDQPSSSTIIKSLTPRKNAGHTRSLATSPDATTKNLADTAYVKSLRNRKTRSLSTVELDKLSAITETKPNIDLEINFELNSDRITRSAKETVDELGKALSDPSLKGNTFVLAGYADATGSPDYNQDLSERRAAAVKEYLIDNFHIPEPNLVTVGYGSTHFKNKDNPRAAENRRVAVTNMDDSATASNSN
jgi:outer membrane protein OmpA-like peptidoglycan-associated protein